MKRGTFTVRNILNRISKLLVKQKREGRKGEMKGGRERMREREKIIEGKKIKHFISLGA